MNLGLGGRGVMGLGLGRSSVSAAAPWYRAGGAPAPIAAYQPKGAASLAASYVNLANPGTYDAAPGTAPTHAAATGWTFGGLQYLTTGVVPASGFSALCRFSNATGSSSHAPFGVSFSAGNQRFYVRVREATYRRYAYGTSNLLVAGSLTSGVVALAGNNAYLDGVSDGTVVSSWTNTAIPLTIGAENTGSTRQSWYWGYVFAFVAYTATLTAPQVAAVSAAMAAL